MTSGMIKRLSAFGVVIAMASCATELPQPSTPPDPPTGLTAQAGDGSIEISWNYPGDASITSYEFRLQALNDADWRDWRAIDGSTHLTTRHTLTLTNYLPYQIQVRAGNAAGLGEPSNTVNATPAPPAPPSAPAGLTAQGGDRSIEISWNDPGDASIISYEVRERQAGAAWPSWRTISGSTHLTTSNTLPNLTAGKLHEIQVRARNAVGASEPSNIASATPLPPPSPISPPPAPTGLTARGEDQRISISWEAPGSAADITSYEVRLRGPGDADWRSWRPVDDISYRTTSQTLPGLTNDLLYQIQVRARNAAGASEPSDAASATPRAPTLPDDK